MKRTLQLNKVICFFMATMGTWSILSGCARPGLTAYSPASNAEKAREDRLLDRLLDRTTPAPSPEGNRPEPTSPHPVNNEDIIEDEVVSDDPAPQVTHAEKAHRVSRPPTQPATQPATPSTPPQRPQPRVRPPSRQPSHPQTKPTRQPPGTTPQPQDSGHTRIRGFWDERAKRGREWTGFTIQALKTYGRELYQGDAPQDIKRFCPRYFELDQTGRLDFWVKLISAIAAKESSYNPRDFYNEGFRDQNGNVVVSRGLLQISLASSNAYRCGMRSEQDLHDPKRNLECGVKILNRWVPRDNVLSAQNSRGNWLGAARYWSVLRDYNRASQTIRALLLQSSLCKK